MDGHNRDNHNRSPKQSNESNIQGFDIEINETDRKRIDLLVDLYQRRIMSHLDEDYIRGISWSDRLADKIASFGGSWRFILYFAFFLLLWIVWNALPFTVHFDPSPFILLNLCLSFIAAFQAPIIMMSQNRHAAKDKHESVIDFAINYKAGQEVDDMQTQLRRIELELAELKLLLRAEREVEIKEEEDELN